MLTLTDGYLLLSGVPDGALLRIRTNTTKVSVQCVTPGASTTCTVGARLEGDGEFALEQRRLRLAALRPDSHYLLLIEDGAARIHQADNTWKPVAPLVAGDPAPGSRRAWFRRRREA